MRIFLSIKYHSDQRNRALIEQISTALQTGGHSTICIACDVENWGRIHYSPAELMRLTFEAIRGCDLLLVELSEKGVGVGIEAGYAAALGKPVWVIAHQGADLSTTLAGIAQRVILYNDLQELSAILFTLQSP